MRFIIQTLAFLIDLFVVICTFGRINPKLGEKYTRYNINKEADDESRK